MHDMSLTSRVLDYLYSIREFGDFCTLKFIDEAWAIKYARLIGHIPPACREGKILQIMGYPYFLSALLREFVSLDLTVTFHGEEGCMLPYDSGGRISRKNGQVLTFEPIAFELERETSPFPGGHFDLLVAIDVLEHVVENPSFVAGEFHRVIKEDGILVLSAAHALRFAHVLSVLKRENVYEPYHGMGIWGRNCREYTMEELKPFLESIGFTIVSSSMEDIHPAGRLQQKALRSFREIMERTFPARQGDRGYGDQIYIVARRSGRRKYLFPSPLYVPEKVEEEESLVPPALRENAGWALPFMEAGFNDWLQLLDGWHEPEPGRFHARRLKGEGNAVLRNDPSRRLLVLEASFPKSTGSRGKLQVTIDEALPCLLEENEAIPGKPGLYRWLYLVPEGKGFLRHLRVKGADFPAHPERVGDAQDQEPGGIELSYLGLFPAHRLIMGTNDRYLLQEGWSGLRDSPFPARKVSRRASLRLISPGGRQRLKVTYMVTSPVRQLSITLTAGSSRFEVPAHTQNTWLSHVFPLETHLDGVLPIIIEIDYAGPPIHDSHESHGHHPGPEIEISHMEIIPG